MIGQNLRRLLGSFALAALIFLCATAIGDWLLGPLILKVVDLPQHTGGSLWVIMVPVLIENLLLFLLFALAAKFLHKTAARPRFITWWLVNSSSAVGVGMLYFLAVIDKNPAPALYGHLGGDMAAALWVLVTFGTALLPLSAYVAAVSVGWRVGHPS